jgi:hypothetical protein
MSDLHVSQDPFATAFELANPPRQSIVLDQVFESRPAPAGDITISQDVLDTVARLAQGSTFFQPRRDLAAEFEANWRAKFDLREVTPC